MDIKYYHVSNVAGLSVIEPRKSTHKKLWVYAVMDKTVGLCFGVKKDDFDFIVGTSSEGVLEMWECYPNAFEACYAGRSCSVYQLADSGFKEGQTTWPAEYVSEQPTKVVAEDVVSDLKLELEAAMARGEFILHKYSSDLEYKAKISAHIVDRLIRFDYLNREEMPESILIHYKDIVDKLKEVCSGKYLK